jgi:hypothetical protein
MVLSDEHLKDWRQMLLRLQHQNLVSNQIQHARQLQESEVEALPQDTEDEMSQSLNRTFDPDDRVFVDEGEGGGRGVGMGQGGKAPTCVLVEDGRVLWACQSPSMPLVGAGTEVASAAAFNSVSHSATDGGGGGGGGGGVGGGDGVRVGKAASLAGGRALSVLPQSRLWEDEEEEWKRSAPTVTLAATHISLSRPVPPLARSGISAVCTHSERHQCGLYGGNMDSFQHAGNIDSAVYGGSNDSIRIFHNGMSNSSNGTNGGNHSASRTSSALLSSTPEVPSRQLKSLCPPPPHSLAEENSGADTEQAAQMREAEALLDGFTLEACRAVLRASGGAVRTGGGGGGSGSMSTVGRAGTGSYGGKLGQKVIGGPEVAEGQRCSGGDSESFSGWHVGQDGYEEAGRQGGAEGREPAAGSNRCSAGGAGDGKIGDWEIFPVNLVASVDTAGPGRHETQPLPVRVAGRKVQGTFDA